MSRAFGTTVASLAVVAVVLAAVIGGTADTTKAGRHRPLRCFGRVPNLHDSTNGDDYLLLGRIGRDVIHGKNGNDRIAGLSGGDSLCGGRGEDTINGGDGFDRIDGGAGYDVCTDGERVRHCEQF